MATEEDLDEFLVQAENFLADNNLGLGLEINMVIVEECAQVLALTPTEIYDLSLDDVNKTGIMIAQYSMYLQKARSKLENTISWCSFYINSQLAKEWKNEIYEFIPKETKSHAISESNSFLQKLMEMRLVAESRLRGIPEKMDNLRNIAFRLGQIK